MLLWCIQDEKGLSEWFCRKKAEFKLMWQLQWLNTMAVFSKHRCFQANLKQCSYLENKWKFSLNWKLTLLWNVTKRGIFFCFSLNSALNKCHECLAICYQLSGLCGILKINNLMFFLPFLQFPEAESLVWKSIQPPIKSNKIKFYVCNAASYVDSKLVLLN